MTNTMLNDLTATRALIADSRDWDRGMLVSPSGCLCLLGAVGVATGLFDRVCIDEARVIPVYDQLDQSPVATALAELIKVRADDVHQFPYKRATTTVISFNDNSLHVEVMELLDDAIDRLQKGEAL